MLAGERLSADSGVFHHAIHDEVEQGTERLEVHVATEDDGKVSA